MVCFWVEVYSLWKVKEAEIFTEILHFSGDLLLNDRWVLFACPGSYPLPLGRASEFQKATPSSLMTVLLVYQGRCLAFPWPTKRPGSPVIPSEHPSLQQESQTKCPKHWGRGESRFTQSVVRKTLLVPTAQPPMAVWSKSSSRLVLPHGFPVCSPPPLG